MTGGAYCLGTQHSSASTIHSFPTPSPSPQADPSGYIDPFPRYLADDTTGWLTYTNNKYRFSITYPPTWKYLEIPKSQYNSYDDQVWFSHQDIHTASFQLMTDFKFTISKKNLVHNWQPQYFRQDDYKTTPDKMGNVPGVTFAGTREGDNATQYAFVGKIGDYYIEELGHETSGYYGKVIFHYFGDEMTVKLNPQEGSGTGTATLTNLGNGKTKVIIELDNMANYLRWILFPTR